VPSSVSERYQYGGEHELTAQRCCLEYNWTWDERCH